MFAPLGKDSPIVQVDSEIGVLVLQYEFGVMLWLILRFQHFKLAPEYNFYLLENTLLGKVESPPDPPEAKENEIEGYPLLNARQKFLHFGISPILGCQ